MVTEPSTGEKERAIPWWERGVIYQVYPRSFQDSDGDGIGDLAGIESRLDYLEELGVDAIWLSPIFPSPMADFGYDVADYCGIDPLFGDLAEFDRLLAAAHARGLKLLLDFVPNHSSDQHPWFVESRSSRDNPKRDWYIWRDPAPDGGPPNNWISDFGGSAWKWDDAHRAILSTRFPEGAARPQLAQSGAARGDDRRAALLVRPRRRRLPHRRAVAHRQGRGLARQSAQSRLPAGAWARSSRFCSIHSTEPARGRTRSPREFRALADAMASGCWSARSCLPVDEPDALLRPRARRACICRSISS